VEKSLSAASRFALSACRKSNGSAMCSWTRKLSSFLDPMNNSALSIQRIFFCVGQHIQHGFRRFAQQGCEAGDELFGKVVLQSPEAADKGFHLLRQVNWGQTPILPQFFRHCFGEVSNDCPSQSLARWG